MMKRIIILTVTLFSLVTFAQEKKGGGREKVRAYKIAYLTEKLDLSAKEAEKFWPLYNSYNDKRRELFKAEKNEIRSKIEAKGGIEKFSDTEAETMLKKINTFRDNQHLNKLAFVKDLRSFLSSKKILQFEVAEMEFNKKLMRKLREQKNKEEAK